MPAEVNLQCTMLAQHMQKGPAAQISLHVDLEGLGDAEAVLAPLPPPQVGCSAVLGELAEWSYDFLGPLHCTVHRMRRPAIAGFR